MIDFRTFRNTDPPALVEIWNESFTGRGAYRVRSAALLEHCLFSKPYFDRNGLIIAEADGKPVGFVLAGFGPNAAETDMVFDVGVICTVAVVPAHRRQKIGSELLKRGEEYLGRHGATQIIGGGVRPYNPFNFGLYGGADAPGVLDSDPIGGPFFAHHGYQKWSTSLVFERRLDSHEPVVDPRFLALRRRYDVQLVPQPEIASWWQECVMGSFEPVEFRLTDKLSGIPTARTLVWEMSAGRQPGQGAAGILDLQVRPDVRRQGLARFLISQMLRYLQEQYFRLIEIHIAEGNQPALGLFTGLEFEQVDVGHAYRKSLDGSPLPPAPGTPPQPSPPAPVEAPPADAATATNS